MIGTRGHDLGGRMSAQSLAALARKADLDSVQLVAYRSLKGIGEEPGFLTHGYAEKVKSAFLKEDIRIALLGCYINIMHDDLDKFKEYLTYANSFGAYMVGTETGSVNPDYSFNTENHSEEAFLKVVGIVKELCTYAEKFGAVVGIEAVHCHVVHTPEKMKRLLDLVDSPNIQVIFDPVNLLTLENHHNRKDIIVRSLELYGNKVAIVHIKDYIIENNQMTMVPIGRGLMDFKHLLALLQQYKYDVDMIIEDYQDNELIESINYLKNL